MEVRSNQAATAIPLHVTPSEYETSFEAYVAELHSPVSHASSPRNISQQERLLSIGLGAIVSLTGLTRGRLSGLGALGLGAGLIYRGVTGHCHGYELLGINTAIHNGATVVPSKQGTHVDRSITIQRPPAELYSYWREIGNLPRIMRHLNRVDIIDNKTSHWTVAGPLNTSFAWDAEIFNDRQNETLAWRSLPGGDLDTAGSVHFTPLPHDRGTIVRLVMRYDPPGGQIGAKLADLFGFGLEQQVDSDLQQFKSLMETGEVSTTAGQPTGSV